MNERFTLWRDPETGELTPVRPINAEEVEVVPAAALDRTVEALREGKYRSGIGHAALRHAVYRMAPDSEERLGAENALARLGEINSLTREALAALPDPERER